MSVISAAKGAPVDWIPMQPAMAVLSRHLGDQGRAASQCRQVARRFSGVSDGQKIFRDADYIPVDPAVPPKVADLRPEGQKFRANLFLAGDDPGSSIGQWAKIASDLFR